MALKPSATLVNFALLPQISRFLKALDLPEGVTCVDTEELPKESSFVAVYGMFVFLTGLKNCRNDDM